MAILSNLQWEAFAQGIVAGKSAKTAYTDAGFSKQAAAHSGWASDVFDQNSLEQVWIELKPATGGRPIKCPR